MTPASPLRRPVVRGIASALVLWSLGLVTAGVDAWVKRGENIETERWRAERGLGPYLAAARIGPLTTRAIAEWTAAGAVLVIAMALWMLRDWAFPTASVLLLAGAALAVLGWHHSTLQPSDWPHRLDFAKTIRTDDYWFAIGLASAAFSGLAPLSVFLLAPRTRRLAGPELRRPAAPRDLSRLLLRAAVGLVAFIVTFAPLFISLAALDNVNRVVNHTNFLPPP